MATKIDLKMIIDDVATYFQVKLPSDATIDQWFTKLDDLNLLAARKAVVAIMTNADTFPRNFPAALKSAYGTWFKSQPRICEESGCNKCLNGLIHAIKDGYTYAFKCGHCRTSPAAYPEATLYWLEEHGYTLDWQHDYQGPTDKTMFKNINNLVKSVDEIPF